MDYMTATQPTPEVERTQEQNATPPPTVEPTQDIEPAPPETRVLFPVQISSDGYGAAERGTKIEDPGHTDVTVAPGNIAPTYPHNNQESATANGDHALSATADCVIDLCEFSD
uniref:Uncharacterized protein n=1 Tax=Tetraselmis chuii TaxID=63592 RepID=A0A7S1SR53_9CHLO